MHDHGILRDISFGSPQLRVKILSNSWLWAKPVNSNCFCQINLRISEKIATLLDEIEKYHKLKIYKFILSKQKIALWENMCLLAMKYNDAQIKKMQWNLY